MRQRTKETWMAVVIFSIIICAIVVRSLSTQASQRERRDVGTSFVYVQHPIAKNAVNAAIRPGTGPRDQFEMEFSRGAEGGPYKTKSLVETPHPEWRSERMPDFKSSCIPDVQFSRYYRTRWAQPRVTRGGTATHHIAILYIDIDLTVGDSMPRFKRNTIGGWPGPGLEKKAYSQDEVKQDVAFEGAATSIASLRLDGYVVRFLTARGDYENAYSTTREWLDQHGFTYDDLIVVGKSSDKIGILKNCADSIHTLCYMIDDFSRGHYTVSPTRYDDVIAQMKKLENVRVEIYDQKTNNWHKITQKLHAAAAYPFLYCGAYVCSVPKETKSSVMHLSVYGHYYGRAKRQFGECAGLTLHDHNPLKEWDIMWLIEQTPTCLKMDYCLHFCTSNATFRNVHVSDALRTVTTDRHQLVNVIPGFVDLSYNKRELCRSMKKAGTGFYPECFLLPEERSQFQTQYGSDTNITWISKPVALSNGAGIKIVRGAKNIPSSTKGVVQRYITNPFTIDGTKIDVRMYGCVAGVDPIRIYVWSENYARVAGTKFDLSNLKDAAAHVTNSVLNKSYRRLTMSMLRHATSKVGVDFDRMWSNMVSATTKGLLSSIHSIGCKSKTHPFPCGSRRFQFFGVDLSIDTHGNAHLLEINADPSFKPRNNIIDVDDSRMYQDLMWMLGITTRGTYMGAHKTSSLISLYCEKRNVPGETRTNCYKTLQSHSGVLSLMISEYENRGEYRLAFPTYDWTERHADILSNIPNFPSQSSQLLYDMFTRFVITQQQEPPGGVDGSSYSKY